MNQIKLPPHARCAAHTLSLICVTDIKSVSGKLHRSALAKSQGIWNKISPSTKASESVKEICGKALPHPIVTRWNSLWDYLVALLQQREHLVSICEVVQVVKFSEELQYISDYIECLRPIAVGLDRPQADECYFGELLPTIFAIMRQLKELKMQDTYKNCYDLLDALLAGLQKRFGYVLDLKPLDSDYFILATLSHPYFKLRWSDWLDPMNKHVHVNRMKELLVNKTLELQCIVTPEPGTQISKGDNKPTKSRDSLFSFKMAENNPETQSDKTRDKVTLECLKYLDDNETEITMLENYSYIKRVFMKYNTPLPSSAPVERLFSYAGMILSPKRRQLTDRTFEKLLLLKANRHIN